MTPLARAPGSNARSALVLLAVLVLLEGCSSCIEGAVGPGCSRHCLQKCEVDSDCSGSHKCFHGCCGECESSWDCPPTTACQDYSCRDSRCQLNYYEEDGTPCRRGGSAYWGGGGLNGVCRSGQEPVAH